MAKKAERDYRSDEEKVRIVEAALAHPGGIVDYAKANKVNVSVIHRWKRAAAEGRLKAAPKQLSLTEEAPPPVLPGNTKYTEEKREAAVREALSSRAPIRSIAERYGVKEQTLYTWVRKAKAREPSDQELLDADETQRGEARAARMARKSEAQEIADLRLEIQVLRANLALARRRGFSIEADIDVLLSGGRRKGR